MIYDGIIIGAGAAGLYCGAHLNKKGCSYLILEGGRKPGLKLLVSGSGQCNFTHGGDIRDFIVKYGEKGGKIRNVLYRHSNRDVIKFFQNEGMKVTERDDGKVFPKSMKAEDVVDCLKGKIEDNGIEIITHCKVTKIQFSFENSSKKEERVISVTDEKGNIYKSKNVVIATGGYTYPRTGSDGSMFGILESLKPESLNIIPPKDGLSPVFVENYSFAEISGISVQSVLLYLSSMPGGRKKKSAKKGDILFTHRNLSGPVILDNSRYIKPGDKFEIDFLPEGFRSGEHIAISGKNCGIVSCLIEETSLPRNFIEVLVKEAIRNIYSVDKNKEIEEILKKKVSSHSRKFIAEIERLIREYSFTASGKAGPEKSMVTVGGVDLGEISLKTMESIKYPGLHFAGEVLDVDGDTGGYNIQFAFSSGYAVAQHILQLP